MECLQHHASSGEVLWCLELVQYLKERAGKWFFSLEREEEGKVGPVTGGESWDSSKSSEKGVLVCSGASSEMERWSRF